MTREEHMNRLKLTDEESKKAEDKSYNIWEKQGGNLGEIRRRVLAKAQRDIIFNDPHVAIVDRTTLVPFEDLQHYETPNETAEHIYNAGYLKEIK